MNPDPIHLELEKLLFSKYAVPGATANAPTVFVLASPRAGSTLLYQWLINHFDIFYFPNLVNEHFSATPILGGLLDSALASVRPLKYSSAYGKTTGALSPSEASLILRRWFGGKHPSQTNSCAIFPEQVSHLIATLTGIHAMTGKPILIKNAWNCFRIQSLAERLPAACFIWLRRGIGKAALSDLESRYRHGSPQEWNSATPHNYCQLSKLPYWEQVVEQQFETNHAVGQQLQKLPTGRFIEIWYEQLCNSPGIILSQIRDFFGVHHLTCENLEVTAPTLQESAGPQNMEEDKRHIDDYIRLAEDRFKPYQFDSVAASG